MSDETEKPADEPAAVVPDDATEVRAPAADLAGGAIPAAPTPAPAAPEAPATVPAPPAVAWTPPDPPAGAEAGSGPDAPAAVVQGRPELAVAGAFAGGLAFALLLKRLAR